MCPTTALAIINHAVIQWDDEQVINEIRQICAPKLSTEEFRLFIAIAKASRLNPFKREIWAVKYKDNLPAQIFVGRDGYKRIAHDHPDYDYHRTNAVYESDYIEFIDEKIKHKWSPLNRVPEQLIGAYCIAKRKSSSEYIYVYVNLRDYDKKQSIWNSNKEVMIQKVAEAQALRMCFQDLLGGTYSEAENFISEKPQLQVVSGATKTDTLNNLLDQRAMQQTIDAETGEILGTSNNGLITSEQLKQIAYLIIEKQLSDERLNKALAIYEVSSLDQLTQEKAQRLIGQLERC